MSAGWSDQDLAKNIADELPPGGCVNLGIGLPTKVPAFVSRDAEILFHSENGIIGMGPDPEPGHEDPDVVNAGKKYVTLVCGASINKGSSGRRRLAHLMAVRAWHWVVPLGEST